MRRGPAAWREGPAGYKGKERAGEAARRDPTAAGEPGPRPGDDCEFKAAMFVSTQQRTFSNSHTWPAPCVRAFLSAPIHRHVHDKLLQVHSTFSHSHKEDSEITCNIHVPVDPIFSLFFSSLALSLYHLHTHLTVFSKALNAFALHMGLSLKVCRV